MKILNLYAGIGGNRKLWGDEHEITAVEWDAKIAAIYKTFFPKDDVVVGDAHAYLQDNFASFDYIWASPPCPTHSRVRKANYIQNKPIFPDMKLYEEIIFLEGYAKCKWTVENVISYYDPLIKPWEVGNHYFWANFHINFEKFKSRGMGEDENITDLQKRKGFDIMGFEGIDKMKTIRNCVEPELGKYIFDCAFKLEQKKLFD
jgi:DNA (cytosine-5)-methyltransferase 1